MSDSRFPEIHSPVSSRHKEKDGICITMEGIDDLFYDNMTDPVEEITRLQDVFDESRNKRYLNSLFQKGVNNRGKFRAFAKNTVGLDGAEADMLFSCAANAFSRDVTGDLVDVSMTKTQFAVGIIRLANLWSLMNDGMVDTSMLAHQTSNFLDSFNEAP